MKLFFTCLLSSFLLVVGSTAINAQNVGDYRSNATVDNLPGGGDGYHDGTWGTPSIWEVFDGTDWVTASSYPTSADGIITISTGDSIRLTGMAADINIDQIVIQDGAVLSIFNNSGIVTVDNGTGDDIIIQTGGKLYAAANTTIIGASGSTVLNEVGGLLTIRNSIQYRINTINNGTLHFGQPGVSAGTISNATIVSNGTIRWIDGNMIFNNSTLTNNGSWVFQNPNNVNPHTLSMFSAGTTNVTNNGTIENQAADNVINLFPSFTNTGVIRGNGSFNFTSPLNTGSVSPAGNAAAGAITLSNNIIDAKSTTLNFDIINNSGVGTGHDNIILNGSTNVSIADASLVVTEAVGIVPDQFILISLPAPAVFTGSFASTTIPANYSIVVNNNTNPRTISVIKSAGASLPVIWKDFSAFANGDKVQLKWSTYQEFNTSHFTIEHSNDGINFSPIGSVAAAGSTSSVSNYAYTHASPTLTSQNFYRLKQYDIDGKFEYSQVRIVRFKDGSAVAVQFAPNPVLSTLQINVQNQNIQVIIYDFSGRTLKRLTLQPGLHSIDMQDLKAGIYQLGVFRDNRLISTQKIVKQ